MQTHAYVYIIYQIMKIKYWMREMHATINQVRKHTLLLMENKVNMRFIMEQQLVGQEKK